MLKTILSIVYIIICVAIIVLVSKQEGKSGLSSTVAGGTSNSYWGKNKGNSIEGSIPKITGILAAVYMILSVILNML